MKTRSLADFIFIHNFGDRFRFSMPFFCNSFDTSKCYRLNNILHKIETGVVDRIAIQTVVSSPLMDTLFERLHMLVSRLRQKITHKN